MFKYTSALVLSLSLSATAFAGPALDVQTSGEGRDLIFVPGLGCSGSVWDDVVAQLSSDFTCHVVSLPCHGAPCPDGQVEAKTIIEKIAALGRARAGSKPVLVGHSYGGYLALRVAAEYPDAYAKVVIVDAQPFPIGFILPDATAEQADQQATMFQNMIANQSEDQFRKQQAMMFKVAVTDTARVSTLVEWRVHSDRAALADAFHDVLSSDLREEIKSIDAETLVLGTWLAAQSTGLTRESALERFQQQYAGVRNCTIRLTDDSRHFIMYDNPTWLVDQIRTFAR